MKCNGNHATPQHTSIGINNSLLWDPVKPRQGILGVSEKSLKRSESLGKVNPVFTSAVLFEVTECCQLEEELETVVQCWLNNKITANANWWELVNSVSVSCPLTIISYPSDSFRDLKQQGHGFIYPWLFLLRRVGLAEFWCLPVLKNIIIME